MDHVLKSLIFNNSLLASAAKFVNFFVASENHYTHHFAGLSYNTNVLAIEVQHSLFSLYMYVYRLQIIA